MSISFKLHSLVTWFPSNQVVLVSSSMTWRVETIDGYFWQQNYIIYSFINHRIAIILNKIFRRPFYVIQTKLQHHPTSMTLWRSFFLILTFVFLVTTKYLFSSCLSGSVRSYVFKLLDKISTTVVPLNT